MATIGLDSGSTYPEQALGMQNAIWRRPFFPAIRWGAIFAGVAVGVSIQLALTLLGIASGLSAVNIAEGEGVGMGPLIWGGISMLISAFIGGYVAARMSGLKRKADGVLHGAVAWAVTTLLFATMATSTGGMLMSSIFNNAAPIARTAGNGGVALGSLLASQLGTGISPAALQTLQQHIQAGRRNDAIQFMVGTMGVDKARAAAIVDQAMILSGSPEQASPQGRAEAEQAIRAASTAAWMMFTAVALSLVLGIAGGMLGAAGARRKTWTSSPEAGPALNKEGARDMDAMRAGNVETR